MPTIGGLDKGYLLTVLDDYKTGLRPSTIMGRIMRAYSEQEVAAIASFYAEQTWVSTDRTATAALVHRGEEIHDSQCETCHEDGGRGRRTSPRVSPASGPPIHSMPWRAAGPRASAATAQDGRAVMKLGDEDLEALAQFYESQK